MDNCNAQESSPVLVVDNLTKRFRHGSELVEAVRGVSLTLEKGEFVAVMGASGSGKSTLLHLIAGLTDPSEGTIRIAGTDINALGDYERTVFRRRHVGLVFQSFNLIPSLNGEENIALPVLLGNDGDHTGEVDHLVSALGLQGIRGRRPDSMSGGEQQRVAIGRALVTVPSLVLADEPTGSLDSLNGRKLCDILKKLCRERGSAVLMVTHNPAVAFAASRIIVLSDGGVVDRIERSEFATVQDLIVYYVDLIEQERREVAG